MMKKSFNETGKPALINRKKAIDMIVRFYLILLKSEEEINPYEINTLYSLLEDLFSDENISWEEQIRAISAEDFKLEEVVQYLNKNLISLDKLRLMVSLIILANADNDFTVAEVTKILDLAKRLNVDTDGFMQMMETIEKDTEEPVSVGGFRYIGHSKRAIFHDYLVLGSGSEANIKLQDKRVSANEILLIKIDRHFFIGTGSNPTSYLNGELMLPNRLYSFPKTAILLIGELPFNYNHLAKIYQTRNAYDIIEFKKNDYDFRIINDRNNYSIILHRGALYKNGKEIFFSREIPLVYDDVIQIKGYQPFNLLKVIEERENIGTEALYPKKLFINSDGGYLSISREETSKTIVALKMENNEFFITSVKKGSELYLNNQQVTGKEKYTLNRDSLVLNKTQFIISNFFEIVLVPFEIEQISAVDIKHYFKDGKIALDGISLQARKGEIVAVMGKSGCGKSTFLKSLSADIIPSYGRVIINNEDLYSNLSFYAQYIGYVPQEDLLYPNLTVYENLYYRGKLILPNVSKEELKRKVSNILTQTNLIHRKDLKVGELNSSLLSGGERKRLNIALELLFEPTLIICDEPTTGLSSIDSEQILGILKNYSEQGKIVIITIHQPSPTVFEKLDKVLIMDYNGRPVYFGDSSDVFSYFDAELDQLGYRKEEIEKKKRIKMPDFFQDIIDYPEYKNFNEKVYEQVEQSLAAKRKFSSNYWRDKYKRKQLMDLISLSKPVVDNENKKNEPVRKKMSLREHLSQFRAFLKRSILMKLRNRTNIFITFAQAPLLALIISFILRSSIEGEGYNYHHNANIVIYHFVSLIVFIFLGLSNSIEEIMGEKKMILREKVLTLKMSYILFSKICSLSLFALLQVLLYYFVSMVILKLPGLMLINILYFFIASTIGYSVGLFVSSFINDRKAIINLLPLILIPQIIFGGAIILYENMNPQLTLKKTNTIPEVVQVIPSRWLFEGLVTAQARLNNYERGLQRIERKRLTLMERVREGLIDDEMYAEEMHSIYALRSDVARRYPREMHTNYNITMAVDMLDGRFLNRGKNVFLSSFKSVGGRRYRTYNLNILILLGYFSLINLATLIKLKYYFRDV